MKQLKVVVTDHIFPSRTIEEKALEGLGVELVFANCRTEDEVIQMVSDADAVLTTYAPVTAKAIAAMTKCKLIARYGVGVDNVAVAEATKRGITVCNVPDYCVHEVSEHALAMLLALTRRLPQIGADVRTGHWDFRPFRPLHRLHGKTLGLIGLGRIAGALAGKATALGLRVLAFDPYVKSDSAAAVHTSLVTLDELLAASDLISIHCPLTPETRGVIGSAAFAKMRPHAILVNVARGGIIDEAALVAALEAGLLGGVGLDVLENEPLTAGHPLLAFDRVLITPHVAFYSEESTVELQASAVNEVVRYLTGEPPRSPVNRPITS